MLPSGFVVIVDIAILAFPLGVSLPFRVGTLVSETRPPVPVIAVVTHALGKVLQVHMLAVGNIASFPPHFYL